MATPELGGLGPRDWTPAEDVEGFAQPNPPLPKLRPATISGIILLVISLVGLCLVGLLHPEFSAIMAVACLLVLAGSFYLLMFKK